MNKRIDTIAVIKTQLKMLRERLNDTHYVEIWHEFKIQEEKLEIALKKLDKQP